MKNESSVSICMIKVLSMHQHDHVMFIITDPAL